jgi:hypothetical protein
LAEAARFRFPFLVAASTGSMSGTAAALILAEDRVGRVEAAVGATARRVVVEEVVEVVGGSSVETSVLAFFLGGMLGGLLLLLLAAGKQLHSRRRRRQEGMVVREGVGQRFCKKGKLNQLLALVFSLTSFVFSKPGGFFFFFFLSFLDISS